jgi:large subunit ribosomal protein L17
MRHGKKLKKLSRSPSHRKSLMMNLAISLFKHERIKTTLTKAKALRPFAEKLITKAKNGNKSLHTIRQLSAKLSDKSVVKKLVEELSVRFKKRPGGYTRIYKCGFRANDSAPVALIELVDYSAKLKEKEKESKGAAEKITEGATTIKDKLTSLVKPKETKAEEKKEVKKEEVKKEEVKKEEVKKEEVKKEEVKKEEVKKVAPKKPAAKKDSKATKSK